MMSAIMRNEERSSDAAFTVITILIGMAVIGVMVEVGHFAQVRKEELAKQEAAFAGKTNHEIVMDCTTDMATQFHIHPKLTIVIDGVQREVPADIGIVNGCMHPLHTHDTSGVLHVEAPVKRDFTLGDFFDVWGKPFDAAHLLDKVADERHAITETVNGKGSADFEKTVLHDGDEIVLTYGAK